MKHRLFTTFAAISLLICLTACAFSVRSYYQDDLIVWPLTAGNLNLYCHRGRLFGSYESISYANTSVQWLHQAPTCVAMDIRHFPTRELWPIQYNYNAGWVGEWHTVIIPHWLIVLLTAPLPLLWLRHWRRHRYPAGRCQACGYDLRATPDRCPECGTAAAKVTA